MSTASGRADAGAPGWLAARVAAPFIAGYFASYLYRAVNAVLAPMLATEFGLSAGGLGLLSSIYFLSFCLFQLPLGLLLDRFGPRRVNGTLLLLAVAGGTWFANADSAGSAIAARALVGLGVSGCLMSSFTAFVLWYPPERIATMNAIAFSFGALGAIVVTVPLELLLRVLPWREAFMLIVAFTLAVSMLMWWWVPERVVRPRGETFGAQLDALVGLMRDQAFLRIAIALGASQFTAVAIQTLWVATWLRDVAGFGTAQVAQGLLAINVAMIVGYLGFGRAADAFARSERDTLPLFAGGIAGASLCLGAIVLGLRTASLPVWCLFACCATAVVLSYSTLSRRYAKAMSGRVNTALNVFGFAGMFTGQWCVGLVLDLWPRTALGYAAEGYTWAFGLLWAVQFAGLAWLWSGRQVLRTPD